MPDFSNRDLDKLFQQGAEHYDFEFKPEAWEQMEQLLERQRRRRRMLWWFAGLLLSLLLLFVLWNAWLSPNESSVSPSPVQVEQLPPENATPPEPVPEKPSPPGLRAIADERPGRSSPAQSSPPGDPPFSPEAEAAPAEAKKNLAVQESAGKKKKENTGFEPPNPDTGERPIQTGAAPARSSALEESMAPLLTRISRGVERKGLPEWPEPPLPSGKIEPVNKRRGGLYIGLNVSEESASVGLDDFGNFGTKAGLSLEYRFPERFSVGAAVYYTRKDYSAGRGEYTPSYGFWTRGIAPEQTVGYCTMLEVPVYAGYYFQSTRKNSFYFEAGLTSFIMLEEHYRFYYENPAPDLIRYWGDNSNYHTWMGILQLSPGYQFRLGDRFAVQGGPFIQIPIAGVGHGDLNLYSLGLNLRLTLRPFGL